VIGRGARCGGLTDEVTQRRLPKLDEGDAARRGHSIIPSEIAHKTRARAAAALGANQISAVSPEIRTWRWEQSLVARKVAAEMRSEDHRRLLIEVAESWERLAEQRFY